MFNKLRLKLGDIFDAIERQREQPTKKQIKRRFRKQRDWIKDAQTGYRIRPVYPITRRRNLAERAVDALEAANELYNRGRPRHEHRATSRTKLRKRLQKMATEDRHRLLNKVK